jgi:hypothetical protein
VQSIKDIIQGLPLSEAPERKMTGLQGLSEMGEQELSLDKKIAQIQAKIARNQEILKQAPVVTKAIKSPKECPWRDNPWRSCDDCQKGKREESQIEPEPLRKIYDVSVCFAEMRYLELISKSGLIGIELHHFFKNAAIDKYNRELYTYLMEWKPAIGGGIYIAAEKDPKNPQGNGTGKSYALHALTHRLCRMGIPCLYGRTTDFLMQLRAAYDDGTQESEHKVLNKYTKVPVLLWDDLGKENFKTEWGPEKFYHVIDYRVRTNKPIIISTNFSLAEIESRFGRDNFGPAIASRLAGFCEMWTLGGPDRRVKGRFAR